MSQILDQIRRAIEESGQTRYRIWQETGISQAQLSRFMHGKQGLSYEAVEKLVGYLGLEIVIRPRGGRKGK